MAIIKREFSFFSTNLIFILGIACVFAQGNKSNTPARAVRHVFPYDFLKFSCRKPLDPKSSIYSSPHSHSCKWTFSTSDSNKEHLVNVTEDCIQVGDVRNITKILGEHYEGYVEIPPKAKAISCEINETSSTNLEPLHVQNVTLAVPLTREYESSHPKIVLQRFPSDYAVRLRSHDVTDRIISINGYEVSSIKLLCVHNESVAWSNYSESRAKILKQLINRDNDWIQSRLLDTDLKKIWSIYLQYLRQIESEFSEPSEIRNLEPTVYHIVPLAIRNVTNATSREYRCTSRNGASSYVKVQIENPKTIGPDEIEMIQQIIQIIDGLAQGKGKGKEPWYTLASLLSIVLILFVYYIKKKLQQQNQNPPASSPKPPAEETEMRTRLRQRNQSEDSAPGPAEPNDA